MRPVTAYKRGWVSHPLSNVTPGTATSNAISGSENAQTLTSSKDNAANTVSNDKGALASFKRDADGGWCMSLAAPEGTKSVADVELDVGTEQLRVKFPASAPQLIGWPTGVGASEISNCSARFSKRRCELIISVPAASEEKDHAVDDTPDSAMSHPCDLHVTCAPDIPTPAKKAAAPASGVCDKNMVRDGSDTQATAAFGDGSKTLMGALTKVASGKVAPGKTVDSPDPEALQIAGTLMMHSAAAIGDTTRLRALLSARVDANAADESGVSALEKACMAAHIDAATVLLDRGSRPNGIATSSSTPLHRAVAAGARGRKLVQLLCARGARGSEKDRAGRTPAELAREVGVEPFPELQ